MGSISDQLESDMLQHAVKRASFTVPTAIRCGLSTADPTENGSGIVEPVGGGYARVAVTTNFTRNATDRHCENTGIINFTPTPATGTWGTISHWFLTRAATGGTAADLLAHGAFSNGPFSVDADDTFAIDPGNLTIDIDPGGFSNFYANKMIEAVFKIGSAFPVPGVYAALGEAAIQDADTGSTGAWEIPNANNYVRKNVEHSTVAWNAPAVAGVTTIDNSGTILFNVATPSGLPTLVSCALVTTLSYGTGEIILYGTLANKVVGPNEIPRFLPGQFAITMD